MAFDNELAFEDALIALLTEYGWEKDVIENPTEQDLIDNWAEILFNNNRPIDRLNDVPLTDGEMQQILEQINALKTPVNLNGFINGKSVSITRDNPEDAAHLGKEVSLKIYDRHEIAAGQSRYQIVKQPKFPTSDPILRNRRGDVMLLINGMPIFHIELKKSGIPISQATTQIEKYAHAGIFSGLFALVQIFVAMTPEETLYFANPNGNFKPEFYFHWADFNNEPINDYRKIVASLLSIPMAHQLIGFYTIADQDDGVLKVLRSYQYYAVNAISDKVAKIDWNAPLENNKPKGGYIWHTTGSGKTMTSFKSAQLIANAKDADKVIFLLDRIELGTQSLETYENFSEANDSVQETKTTYKLIEKLKSTNSSDTLIVSSIQKMSNIQDEGINASDIQTIQNKRLVFIIDEAHRSTFGDMLRIIKQTFPNAVMFGFTGTPIFSENEKKKSTTSDVFGDELHRYSIADGIRDRNVLGFDPYLVTTFKDKEVRKAVALHKAKADTENDVWEDPKKQAVYDEYMDSKKVPMAGFTDNAGKYHKGIEDHLPMSQYDDTHKNMVVTDILDSFATLSRGSKFHAIFATSSITDAITYYRLLKAEAPQLRITALFDPNEGNDPVYSIAKEDGLKEIITDYNARYEQSFSISTHAKFKKDIANRLAHKETYKRIENDKDKQLDLLIVVDQMLTGYDSKWLNTLYLDKLIEYQNIIQAFSRTNRLFGYDKPFGTIRYYRKPHTMHRNIENAVKLYSGNKVEGLFADNLYSNLNKMNHIFADIDDVFRAENVNNFDKLPEEPASIAKFAKLFRDFNEYLEASEIQGFIWDKLTYQSKDKKSITLVCDEQTYLILALRYKELYNTTSTGTGGLTPDAPFDLTGHLNEIDTGRIDADYLNDRYKKYLKALNSKDFEAVRETLHKSFATLTQTEQKYANIFLHDIETGKVTPDPSKTLKDYITEYQTQAENDYIHEFASALGMDEALLREMYQLNLTKDNINEFGRLDELKATVNKEQAQKYIEAQTGEAVPLRKVAIKVDGVLRDFLLGN